MPRAPLTAWLTSLGLLLGACDATPRQGAADGGDIDRSDGAEDSVDTAEPSDGSATGDDPDDALAEAGQDADADADQEDALHDDALVVITFNVGTTPGLPHDSDDRSQGEVYSADTASLVDEHYNNSLAWMPAERRLIAWIGELAPDLIAMQELYYDPWCADEEVPVFPGLDLICEVYDAAAPLQIARLLGPDYQIACGLRKPDTCLGVRRSLGTVRECAGEAPCIGGLDGRSPVSGCTSRDRAGRVHIDRPDGRALIVVALHGTSGGSVSDTACRLDIFRQIWEDRGDGEPLVGVDTDAIVLGDFNTDPVLFVEADPSAAYLAETIAVDGDGWRWHSPIDPAGPRSYALASIDHVVSNAFAGDCVIPGSSEAVAPVWDRVFWDHRPVVCALRER